MKIKRQTEALRMIGAQMANLCFNLGQGIEVTDDHRATMRTLAKEWDRAMVEFRLSLEKKA